MHGIGITGLFICQNHRNLISELELGKRIEIQMLTRLLVAFSVATLVIGAPNERAPVPPAHVVLKPTFMSGHESFSGGTAFLCTVPGVEGTFLLTAQHLFGPACGLKRELSWQEVPKIFVVVTALSIVEPTH